MPVGRGANDVTETHQTHGSVAHGVTGAVGPSAVESQAPGSPLPESRDIPQATVTRLATYLRVLGMLADRGTIIVSSEELAAASGVGSAKLRKDLSFLGPNGVRGVGYDVTRLRARIERALGLDRGHKVVLVGVGNLGQALAGYGGFGRRGFSMVGLFDSDPDRVGTPVGDLVVRHVDELEQACAELEATIGVISTPDEAAQDVCDRLVGAGLRCILSFSPTALDVPDHVEMRRVDLAVEMQVLSFNSARNTESAPGARAAEVVPTAPRVRIGHSAVPSTAPRNGSVIAP
ncbi:redox-sensing transcriptional repressor Rex [Rhodococcus oxybenzonivorans]|uniref:redox-sensing transcriptional repressor Rex n=1 Tax=Rhodococcus TaxID=1827 RepID=UPI00131FF236|nr:MULTISPECIES: redox-sensing transcriptional repressor Rex [Rhodococcus]MDV7353101.1 redox-sensing transcriptional repressor Rex [Rhodococcus oxybenzonivorans]QHE68172.1 Redox-sensitive transcriptional regulator (AT-rich DNA-binding protein) [Rhodococcus sp. WAY2]